jgi:membrane-bound serine protease (ClpP class)
MTKKSLIFSLLLSLLLASALAVPAAAQGKHAAVIKINDVITPAIAEFVSRSIEQATKENAACLIIQMDTPGGLDLSMRDIIKDIMNAEIPVIVYVGPSGARAASAGAIITIAADIAAMAPGTNIGAAHPVAMGGGKMDRTMAEKVVNDAVAYVKSIAQKKGRNVDWAVRAVRDSVSIPETEALKLKVIDLIAKDLNELLEKADGKTVEKPKGAIKLATKGLKIQELEMGFRQRFLATLSNPNLAYILMMIGMVGLYFELAHPGAIFPGVIGGISLILAFFAFRTLPVNYAGVLLIILGVFLFIAEIKIASYGLLTMGGLVSLAIGSIMLFDSPAPFLRASFSVIIPTVLATAAFFIFVVAAALKAQLARPTTGAEGLVGEIGVAKTRLAPEGKVFVHGEWWNAYADEGIEPEEKVRVLKNEGLKLKVERVK